MSLKEFDILDHLGDGSFSSVYKVIKKSTNKVYALKRVLMNNLNLKQKENALNEVRILASIKGLIYYRIK